MSDRLNVFPSRMVLTGIKERKAAAETGWDLLKFKSDAIKMNLNTILKKILDTKRRVGASVKDSAFAHTEAVWAAGDFNSQVIENTTAANYRIKTRINNVAGVKLPVFDRLNTNLAPQKDIMVGLSKGGQAVNKARESFQRTLEDLIQLASLQTSLKTLDQALKVTNRKVNALEFVIMPQLDNTIKYIISELDELEREDQYRIKKVKDIRTRDEELEAEQALKDKKELEARLEAQGIKRKPDTDDVKTQQPKSVIQQEKYAVDALFD